MNFKELLYRARQGDEDAILEIFEMYRPLLIKNALVDGIFDEDLYQELTAELLKCIRYFRDVDVYVPRNQLQSKITSNFKLNMVY